MRNNLSSRLHELEQYLLVQPRTQKEIAERFAVDRKTVCRGIDKLTHTTSVSCEKRGRNTLYFISEADFKSPQFTSIELAALVLSREAILAGGALPYDSPFAAAGKSLLDKVQAKMPARVRRNLDALSKIIGTAVVPNKDYSKFGGVIEELTAAALEERTVSMRYESLSSSRNEVRLFDPYNIYLDPDGATLKTIGFDCRNSRISPFSLDRIRSIKITKEKFSRPPDFDLRKFLAENCFNGIHGEPIALRLKVKGVTAAIFAERQFHPSQRCVSLKKSKDRRVEEIEIEMRVAAGRGLERFILSWLPDIEVVAPDELRLRIRQIVSRASI